jgi:hypothetical protein
MKKFPSGSQVEECCEGSPPPMSCVWSWCCECVCSFRNYLWGMSFGNWKSEADIKFEQSYCNVFSWSFFKFHGLTNKYKKNYQGFGSRVVFNYIMSHISNIHQRVDNVQSNSRKQTNHCHLYGFVTFLLNWEDNS